MDNAILLDGTDIKNQYGTTPGGVSGGLLGVETVRAGVPDMSEREMRGRALLRGAVVNVLNLGFPGINSSRVLRDYPELLANPNSLRDAYLEPFSGDAPAASLREIYRLVLALGHLGRALDWDHMLDGTPDAARAEWQPRVALWLRRWLAEREVLRSTFSR